jgi:hypothetical protein
MEKGFSLLADTVDFRVMTRCASTHVGALCSPSCRVTSHGQPAPDTLDLSTPADILSEKVRHHIRSGGDKD